MFEQIHLTKTMYVAVASDLLAVRWEAKSNYVQCFQLRWVNCAVTKIIPGWNVANFSSSTCTCAFPASKLSKKWSSFIAGK